MTDRLSMEERQRIARQHDELVAALGSLERARDELWSLRCVAATSRVARVSFDYQCTTTGNAWQRHSKLVELPMAVLIQQQAYVCQRLERLVVQLHGVVPTDPRLWRPLLKAAPING
jgi:hypothetical protein